MIIILPLGHRDAHSYPGFSELAYIKDSSGVLTFSGDHVAFSLDDDTNLPNVMNWKTKSASSLTAHTTLVNLEWNSGGVRLSPSESDESSVCQTGCRATSLCDKLWWSRT